MYVMHLGKKTDSTSAKAAFKITCIIEYLDYLFHIIDSSAPSPLKNR
jgi:hypothetical protein